MLESVFECLCHPILGPRRRSISSTTTCMNHIPKSLRHTFLIIITRNGSLIPKVSRGLTGVEIKVVLTFVPIISNTDDWMSGSVIRFIWPFLTRDEFMRLPPRLTVLLPYCEWFRTDWIENRKKSALVGVSEHDSKNSLVFFFSDWGSE